MLSKLPPGVCWRGGGGGGGQQACLIKEGGATLPLLDYFTNLNTIQNSEDEAVRFDCTMFDYNYVMAGIILVHM